MTAHREDIDTQEPMPSDVLAAVVEDHFRTLLGLSEEERDRLRDAGAGVILQQFETRLADTAGGLGGLVGQQARQVEDLREKLFGWLSELDEPASSADTGSEDGASEAGGRSADAGNPARSADDDDQQTGEAPK